MRLSQKAAILETLDMFENVLGHCHGCVSLSSK